MWKLCETLRAHLTNITSNVYSNNKFSPKQNNRPNTIITIDIAITAANTTTDNNNNNNNNNNN
jgi:hypothetical protein